MFSHDGNYLGDLGFRTTTQLRWLADAQKKAPPSSEQLSPPPS
jgi:hypothetical protein